MSPAIFPTRYSDDAWSVVSRCSIFSQPRGAVDACLSRRGLLDFTQGMLGALEALGSEEMPSDLLFPSICESITC
jgi:hypothetical protein